MAVKMGIFSRIHKFKKLSIIISEESIQNNIYIYIIECYVNRNECIHEHMIYQNIIKWMLKWTHV